MKTSVFPASMLLAATLACSGGDASITDPLIDTELGGKRGVTAVVYARTLVLRNNTATNVHVAVVETRYFEMALRMWCFGYDPCGTSLPPGKSIRIPFEQIPGYNPSAITAEVFWWKSGVDPQSEQPLQLHQFQVRLRRS